MHEKDSKEVIEYKNMDNSDCVFNTKQILTDFEKKDENQVKERKEDISDDLIKVLSKILNYLEGQPKRQDKNCFLCSSNGTDLKNPNDIQILFKLYSAIVFCLIEHCKQLKYEKNLIEAFFALENFLLDQIARPELGFYDAYIQKQEDTSTRDQLLALGQIFRVDNAIHINREEELESITYKLYRRLSFDLTSLTDQEVNLICLILYKRNESFRFFKVFADRKLLVNHRIAILFSLKSNSIVDSSDLVLKTSSFQFEFDDLSDYKIMDLYIRNCKEIKNDFFKVMSKKLGLNKFSKLCKQVEYEKQLENFEGIIVTKKCDLNIRKFKKWFKREKDKQHWNENISIWIQNRKINNIAVDLSMIGICAQYHEFEKGQFIYEKLEKPRDDQDKKEIFVKYCFLCISALKEGNKHFINGIVTKIDDEFSRIISNTEKVENENQRFKKHGKVENEIDSPTKTILEIKHSVSRKKSQSDKVEMSNLSSSILHKGENTKEKEKTIHSNTSECVKDKPRNSLQKETKNYISKGETIFDELESNLCIEIKDATDQDTTVIEQEFNEKVNLEENQQFDEKRSNSNNNSTLAIKSISESNSEVYDSAFIGLWTFRLINLIKKVKQLKKNSNIYKEVNIALFKSIFDNILYFEKGSRKEILETVLCDICINDQIVQLVLKGLYCYCVSCKESNLKHITDADLVYNFCEKIYSYWKQTRSTLNFFKRKDPSTKQEIYCCMLGVCCETDKKKGFMNVCQDLKSSSTDLNGEMIRIFERFHMIDKCGCNFFNVKSKKQDKKHIIKHICQNK